MISPPSASYSGGPRRTRYSRSPSDGDVLPSKRSKPSNSSDPYDRDHGSKSDQHRLYTSICVKNINPKITDLEIRDLCSKKFTKYGTNSVKVYHRNQERVAFVNFTNCEDARKARHAKTGLVWENMQVLLEPVYYRKTIPAEQPIKPESPRERSPPTRRQRRPSPPSPSPPPVRSRSHHQPSSSRHQKTISPPPSPPPRSSRPPRRPYSPYIPLPPDLVDYVGKNSSRQRSSPSPVRRHHHHHKQTSKQQRSPSPNSHRSASPLPSRRNNLDTEQHAQQEPTRSLFVANLDRDITESKLKEIFGRYGTIEEVDLKKPTSSSKRPYAFIQYENMDMAYEARRAMDGQFIGKTECKIGYGKIVPTKYLWVGNIPINIQRHELEHAFSRYGPIKKLNYSTGDPTAIITYIDIEDAIKARSKLTGAIKIINGRIVRNESHTSPSSRPAGFRIDYLDRPTSRRFVIVRPQQKTSNRRESRSASSDFHSRHSSPASTTQNHARSPSNSNNNNNNNKEVENNITEDVKTETHSRSPTPPILNTIKQRRSTDHSETSSLTTNLSTPIAGRTFYGPLGSYLSPKDTANVNNINELMILCEQLNSSATKSNTALATVYPVQFILKSDAYDARMHFLAGSPTLASLLLGQPGDLVAAKTELKITQRLRLDRQKLEDLERILRTSVTNVLAIIGNNSHTNLNGHLSNDLISISNRKQLNILNQTKFSLLIASPKIYNPNESSKTLNGKVKNERISPHSSNENDKHLDIKKEKTDNDDNDDDDESSLSRLISYLSEKEAAGVISIPFYPTYYHDHSSRQEIAVLHIFPPCEFSKKLLKIICPSIHFSNDSTAIINDEHLMIVIVHSD